MLNNSGSRQGATDEHVPSIIPTPRVPSKPDRLVAECDGGSYMIVKWTQPEDDDVADITRYVIKYGDDNTDVDNYATVEVAGNTTNFQFTHQLNEQTRYQFAVAAVNATGRGEFSELSDYISTDIGETWYIY